jgi:hypothetical protein
MSHLPNTWETFCRKKVGYHRCGANPNPAQQTEDEVLEIPRFPGPTATGRKSTIFDAQRRACEPGTASGNQQRTSGKAGAGACWLACSQPAVSCCGPGWLPRAKGKPLAKKFFRVVITLLVGYLVDEWFGKYSDWETIRMSSLPKERYL